IRSFHVKNYDGVGHDYHVTADVRFADFLDPAVASLGISKDGSTFGSSRSFHLASRSEEHTSELQSLAYLVCRLLLEKKKNAESGHGADPHFWKDCNDALAGASGGVCTVRDSRRRHNRQREDVAPSLLRQPSPESGQRAAAQTSTLARSGVVRGRGRQQPASRLDGIVVIVNRAGSAAARALGCRGTGFAAPPSFFFFF